MAKPDPNTPLQSIAQHAQLIIDRFFLQPETGLYYSFVDPYDPEQVNLPTVDEIENNVPNSNGWATPIEDCNLLSSGYLPSLLDRYTVTRDPSHAKAARRVVTGLLKLQELSTYDGFVPRGVLPDGITHYRDASVDHESYWVMALWHYFRSPVADAAEKARILEALSRFAEATEEHDWNLLREDGRVTSWGRLVKNPNVPRAKAVVLMLLAVAFEVTGNPHWYQQYLYFRDTHEGTRLSEWDVEQLATEASWVSAQTASILSVLLELEREEKAAEFYSRVLVRVSESAVDQMTSFVEYETDRGWRECEFRTRTLSIPLSALAALCLCPDDAMIVESSELTHSVLYHYDLDRDAKQLGLFTAPALFYWRLAARGLVSYDPRLVPGQHEASEVALFGIPSDVPFQRHSIGWYNSFERRYFGLPQQPGKPESQHFFVG